MGHGHADCLSFVLQRNSQQIVLDPGTFSYTQDLRNLYRGPAVHATLLIDDQYPAKAAEGPFQWQSACTPSFLGRITTDYLTGVAGSLAFTQGDCIHHRAVYSIGNSCYLVYDKVFGQGCHGIRRHLPLAAVDWIRESPFMLRSASLGVTIWFSADRDLTLSLEPLDVSPCYGQKEQGTLVVATSASELPGEMVVLIDLSGSTENRRIEKGERGFEVDLLQHGVVVTIGVDINDFLTDE